MRVKTYAHDDCGCYNILSFTIKPNYQYVSQPPPPPKKKQKQNKTKKTKTKKQGDRDDAQEITAF